MKEIKLSERPRAEDDSQAEIPQDALDRLIWASRLYLSSRAYDTPSTDWLATTFGGRSDRRMFMALMRVWDSMLVSTNEQMILHTPECSCMSPHEQALITGLRCLQNTSAAGFYAAMSSVLPPAAVRLIRPAMLDLAAVLSDLERRVGGLRLVHDADIASPAESQRVH
ncbi:MAG: hypothetical protein AAGE85_18310 [Pseudomonadota bacterium]